VSRINAKRLKRFALHQLGLESYLRDPGGGRPRPEIPAAVMIWALLIGQIVRRSSYHGVEELVHSPARSALEVSRRSATTIWVTAPRSFKPLTPKSPCQFHYFRTMCHPSSETADATHTALDNQVGRE